LCLSPPQLACAVGGLGAVAARVYTGLSCKQAQVRPIVQSFHRFARARRQLPNRHISC